MLREFVPEPAYSTTDDDTVYALLSRRAQKNPDDLIAQWQDDETRQWHDVTAGQMLARVRAVAKGLIGLGVKAGSMWSFTLPPVTSGVWSISHARPSAR